jgi:Fe-S-cluster containining protein
MLPWYKDGLKFSCTGCGKCCTGPSGFVFVTESEMQGMADSLNISLDLFKRKYTRRRNNQYALTERKIDEETYACIFLNGKQCGVYQNRPQQCKTYPFWPENIHTPEAWALTARECEGINKEAPVVPYEAISAALEL